MSNTTTIRPIVRADLPHLRRVIASTQLFPPDMLEGMMAGYLNAQGEPVLWLTTDDPHPVAIAYCAPEDMSDGTWNLYLIAVHSDQQGKGFGRSLMAYVEDFLAVEGARILLVETSGTDDFIRTRQFYRDLGYEEEARIRDFYAKGDDKIIFRKAF